MVPGTWSKISIGQHHQPDTSKSCLRAPAWGTPAMATLGSHMHTQPLILTPSPSHAHNNTASALSPTQHHPHIHNHTAIHTITQAHNHSHTLTPSPLLISSTVSGSQISYNVTKPQSPCCRKGCSLLMSSSEWGPQKFLRSLHSPLSRSALTLYTASSWTPESLCYPLSWPRTFLLVAPHQHPELPELGDPSPLPSVG